MTYEIELIAIVKEFIYRKMVCYNFVFQTLFLLLPGDMFGVLVSYFGEDMSTVMFLKNGVPVATRYVDLKINFCLVRNTGIHISLNMRT